MAAMKLLVLLLVVTLAHTRSHHKKERKLRPSQRNQRVGECSTSTMPDTFDIVKFAKIQWNELYRLDYDFEQGLDCIVLDLSLSNNSTKLDLELSGSYPNSTTRSISTTGTVKKTQNETQWYLSWDTEEQLFNMVVLDTDFTHYAILYACRQIKGSIPTLKEERGWVLSTKTYFDKPILIMVDHILDELPEDFTKFLTPVYTFCKGSCEQP